MLADLTEFRTLYGHIGWGQQWAEDFDGPIIQNRNKFAVAHGGKKMRRCERGHLSVRRYVFGDELANHEHCINWADHLEVYMKPDKSYLVLFSPYTWTDKDKMRAHYAKVAPLFAEIEPLYHPRATTFLCKVPGSVRGIKKAEALEKKRQRIERKEEALEKKAEAHRKRWEQSAMKRKRSEE